MSIVIFILLLVGLIIVHECGHFFAAKLFGIRVDELGIGFPPRLVGRRFGETVYSINWLPLGGFVRIFGERADEGKGDPRSFSGSSLWVQAVVVAAGVLCNFLFAWLILSAGFMAGLPTVLDGTESGVVRDVQVTVLQVSPDSPAQAAGFLPGDVVTHIRAGDETLPRDSSSAAARAFIGAHDETLTLTLLREGTEMELSAAPAMGVVEGRKALGITLEDLGIVSYAPLQALYQGGALTWLILEDTAKGLWNFGATLFSGRADFTNVAGPVGIAQVGGAAVSAGYASALLLVAVISINLGLINLIPVPGLDGGRLVFIAVEAVKGSPVSDRLTVGLTVMGFVLLAALMLLVTYHDLIRILG